MFSALLFFWQSGGSKKMNPAAIANPSWTTASFGTAADTSPIELSALGEHLYLCKAPHGRLFAVHCIAESMHGFVAARFVTTIVASALLVGLVFLML
jgi:hypothetical protein